MIRLMVSLLGISLGYLDGKLGRDTVDQLIAATRISSRVRRERDNDGPLKGQKKRED